MAKLSRRVGATSNIFQVFIADSSSTTGAGLAGLAFNTASLTAYYHRDTDTTATAISLVTATVGTFTSSGFKEIDATNMPGWYMFCPPDAALATGAKSVAFHLKGATNMAPLPIEVDLDAQVDVTHWLGTVVATPATAGIPDVNVKNIDNDAASASGTVTFPNATLASTTNITAGTVTTVTNLTNAPSAGDFTATMKTSIGTAVAASAVASVTGSVGSIATGGIASASFASGATIPRCTLTDTLTTYTSNTPQTGDAYARIGANGASLTSLASAANMVKVLAAVYDTAPVLGDVITLSNGATQTVTASGRVTA